MGYNATEYMRNFWSEYRRESEVLMGLNPEDRKAKIDSNYAVAMKQENRTTDEIPAVMMGAIAATGMACSGPHLSFLIRIISKWVMQWRMKAANCWFFRAFSQVMPRVQVHAGFWTRY